MPDFLLARELSKQFESPDGAVHVLRSVSFEVQDGSSLVVMGPSGSGKSTLLNIIGTLEDPTAGSVAFEGTALDTLSATERAVFRNTKVGFVFQDHHLLPQCTAIENVLLPCLAAGSVSSSADARGRELLETVGLAGKEGRFPSELSGGERQRVAVARAMINEPRLLLCDEPTGNLDVETGKTVVDLFKDLRDTKGVALLVVTHNDAVAAALGRTARLEDGRLHE
jgi:lipoprotein-releasing system ATP-binding protein